LHLFLYLCIIKLWGALIIRAEIIPLQPDPDNAGGGKEYQTISYPDNLIF
jgi:hypothetical protein